jgi:hypothetical protein
MTRIEWGSIQRWPGKLRDDAQRIRPPFKAKHADTIRMLERELRMINAETCVVQIAAGAGLVTADGRPYAGTRLKHPGVIVSFSKPVQLPGEPRPRKVPLAFPADRFTSWESNLRAVAIALEDLRRIDRYGVTSTGEQYTGFKALPGPMHQMPTMTTDEAATFVAAEAAPLVDHITDPRLRTKARAAGAGGVLSDPAVYDALYRMAAKRLHPDVSARPEQWQKLAEAKRLLDRLHYPTDAANVDGIRL